MDHTRWNNLLAVREAYDAGSPMTGESPLEAFLEVAARCNLHCQMCAINYDSRYLPGSKRPPFLTPELFSRLEPIFPRLVRAYLFGLGEPLLNRNLVDYVRALSRYGVDVWFNTNGTLIDERKAEDLAEAGAGAITVSIDGATKETYERIRVGSRYEAVLGGIRALVRAARIHGRPRVNLSFVAMASNLHELPGLVDLAGEVGAPDIHVEPLYSQVQHDLREHYARENLGQLGSARVDELFSAARERADARGVRLASRFLSGNGSADYVERARQMNIWWTCNEAWTSIWVTSAGEVRTCCLNDTSFGNLFEQEFKQIWNGQAFREFRSEHAAGRGGPASCRNCIKNGRVRHSPFLEALEPVTYRPLRGRDERTAKPVLSGETAIDWPPDGETVTDPLMVLGRLGAGERRDVPDVVIDRGLRIPISQAGVVRGRDFVVSLDMPYLTEGAHLISLRTRGSDRDLALRTVHVWKPAGHRSDGRPLPATSAVALGMPLPSRSRRARIQINGRRWKKSSWICAETPRGWLGMAWADLSMLPPGIHEVAVQPSGRKPSLYRVERLPSHPQPARAL